MTPQQASFTLLEPGQWQVHGTAVALEGQAMLLLGPSGAGKSTLAAGMIALGCTLVADDAVHIRHISGDALLCSAPQSLPEKLELRGLGLLPMPLTPNAALSCCLQLSRADPPRFPPDEHIALAGTNIPYYTATAHTGLAAQAFLLLKYGGRTLRS